MPTPVGFPGFPPEQFASLSERFSNRSGSRRDASVRWDRGHFAPVTDIGAIWRVSQCTARSCCDFKAPLQSLNFATGRTDRRETFDLGQLLVSRTQIFARCAPLRRMRIRRNGAHPAMTSGLAISRPRARTSVPTSLDACSRCRIDAAEPRSRRASCPDRGSAAAGGGCS